MTDVLVTDLDGTLVHGREVNPADVEALRAWREAGNKLAIATGRSVMLTRLALDDAERAAGEELYPDAVICASGTTLLGAQGQVLRCDPIPRKEVRRAAEYLMARTDCAVVATTLDDDYLLHNPLPEGDSFHKYAGLYTPATLEEILEEDVTSMPVRVPDDAVADWLSEELVRLSGGAVGAPRSTDYLDVVPAGQDKGTAVLHLRAFYANAGITLDRVICAGDSWNDIPMFEVADLACCMDTARPDVQQAALDSGGRIIPTLAALVTELL